MKTAKEINNTILKTYRKDIWSKFMKAITTYDLLQEHDHIAVCISGGKDSMLLAKCFQLLQRFSKIDFLVSYVVMDPGYSKKNRQKIIHNAKYLDIPIHIFNSDIFDSVVNLEKNPCYVCARMRRGYLYHFAQTLGCNKIALGHHFDDVIETNVMNLFYAGEIRTMMPKLYAKNFIGMQLIRPFYLIQEKDIIRWQEHLHLDFLLCACKFTSNLELDRKEQNSKRKEVKQWIQKYSEMNPFLKRNIFKSMSNVNTDKVLRYYNDEEEVSFLDTYDHIKKD
ncbi:MAG: tRNA 2-thiocytidine biosynthesis TtcA family protein [Breznakia sp.]